MIGPTPTSNWLVPGKVLVGANPDGQRATLENILDQGIYTFVCLQGEIGGLQGTKQPRGPYAALAEELLKQKTSTIGAHATQVDFLHLPIEDFSVAPDDELSELADRCCELTRSGTKMYIHCQGGHGRTGTLAAILLGRLYSLPAAEALRLCQQYHDTRADSGGAHSPETSQQRAQVVRLLDGPVQEAPDTLNPYSEP